MKQHPCSGSHCQFYWRVDRKQNSQEYSQYYWLFEKKPTNQTLAYVCTKLNVEIETLALEKTGVNGCTDYKRATLCKDCTNIGFRPSTNDHICNVKAVASRRDSYGTYYHPISNAMEHRHCKQYSPTNFVKPFCSICSREYRIIEGFYSMYHPYQSFCSVECRDAAYDDSRDEGIKQWGY